MERHVVNKLDEAQTKGKTLDIYCCNSFRSLKNSTTNPDDQVCTYFYERNNVCISWINDPTEEEVEKIVNKYEYGSFNGMTDSYEYDNVKKDIPQVFYVFCEREEKKNRIEKRLDLIR